MSEKCKMETDPFCIFNCENMNEDVRLFNQKTLKTCREKLKIRVACSLKYKDVILPTEVDNVHGYHRTCYKYFTSIYKKTIEDYERKMLSETITSGNSDQPGPSHTDTSGMHCF